MKTTILALLLICIGITPSFAATNITTPTVSGHWTASGSPYYIYNVIEVDPGQSLIIDPGVQVLFKGPYNMLVWGSLQAIGTAASPIVFDVVDTTGWHIDSVYTYDGAWGGIYFGKYTGASDISALGYCNFTHCKYGGVAVDRSMHIDHCNFNDIKGRCLSLLGNKTGTHEVSNCKFYNNSVSLIGAVLNVSSTKATWYVHDNELYDNTGDVINCDTSNLLFSRNSVYNNNGTWQMLSFAGYYKTPCYVVLNENKIYNNRSTLSAVIYCDFVIADISNNYIANNYHLEYSNCGILYAGGAMFLKGSGDYQDGVLGNGIPSLYTVRNNVIANNYSAISGGAISVNNATTLIANNTIINNKAPWGGGIHYVMGTTITTCIRNNIFLGNVNESGSLGNVSVANGVKNKFKYDHNWSRYTYSTDVMQWNGSGSLVLTGDTTTNIVGIDPGMVSPTLTANYAESALAADFSLAAGSACINKGINAAVSTTLGQLDCAGNDRIKNEAVDIGAYEYSATPGTTGPSLQADSIYPDCCAIIPPEVVSIRDISSQNGTLNVYPNPASSIVFIAIPQENGVIHFADVTGKQIMTKEVTGAVTLFDIHALPRGIYYATWAGDNNTISKKIVVE